MNQQRQLMWAAVAAIVLIAAALAFRNFCGGELVLENGRTGEVYARYPIREGEEFSVGFLHSVNKSPLTDIYQIRQGKIIVVRTIYYNFGAGVQTELEEGQTLTYGEDGSMIISGIDREIAPLSYFVGTVSDHTLSIGGGEVSLRELCGRNSLVTFSYRP